ncbi:MAG: GAF domain-containing protein, partial [Chloroflexota bacterium]
MQPLTTATTLINSLTLVMTLALLIIIIWHDRRKEQNQFFALFLFAVTLWSSGTLLLIASSVIGIEAQLQIQVFAAGVMRTGFSVAIVMIYAFTAILVSVRPRHFQTIITLALLLLFCYQFFIEQRFSRAQDVSQLYQSSVGLYLVFGVTTLYLLWRYRARVPSYTLRWGVFAFVMGQGISALESSLQTLSISILISSSAVMVLGLSLLHREIILPLRDRNSQVEAMHSMSLAVTSQLAVQTIIRQIVQQAEQWLRADAVALFLKEQDRIRMAEVTGLPRQFVDITLPIGEGVSGQVIETKKSVILENYATDWSQEPDLPLATQTFGAVVCVPLVSGEETIGALMVISGKHNRAFNDEDVYLLEMLGA